MACIFCDQTPDTANAVEALTRLITHFGLNSLTLHAAVSKIMSTETDLTYWKETAQQTYHNYNQAMREIDCLRQQLTDEINTRLPEPIFLTERTLPGRRKNRSFEQNPWSNPEFYGKTKKVM